MSPGGRGRPKKVTTPDPTNKPRRKAGKQPTEERRPRREFRPADDDHKHIVVRFSAVDVGGPWCLSKATPEHLREILTFVTQVEKMTIDEAQTGGHPLKDYDIDELPSRDARERLVELNYDDETRISRLRLRGPLCLYGFRREERFYVLWWDPTHSIWPTQLKHT